MSGVLPPSWAHLEREYDSRLCSVSMMQRQQQSLLEDLHAMWEIRGLLQTARSSLRRLSRD